uniref:RNase H type-1 domain-containing protein n=1 Tax=Ditylenchus dipsaci TaxID=166011 RepID=A0A915EQQ2_9BILA
MDKKVSHAGERGNELADRLARMAIDLPVTNVSSNCTYNFDYSKFASVLASKFFYLIKQENYENADSCSVRDMYAFYFSKSTIADIVHSDLSTGEVRKLVSGNFQRELVEDRSNAGIILDTSKDVVKEPTYEQKLEIIVEKMLKKSYSLGAMVHFCILSHPDTQPLLMKHLKAMSNFYQRPVLKPKNDNVPNLYKYYKQFDTEMSHVLHELTKNDEFSVALGGKNTILRRLGFLLMIALRPDYTMFKVFARLLPSFESQDASELIGRRNCEQEKDSKSIGECISLIKKLRESERREVMLREKVQRLEMEKEKLSREHLCVICLDSKDRVLLETNAGIHKARNTLIALDEDLDLYKERAKAVIAEINAVQTQLNQALEVAEGNLINSVHSLTMHKAVVKAEQLVLEATIVKLNQQQAIQQHRKLAGKKENQDLANIEKMAGFVVDRKLSNALQAIAQLRNVEPA